MKKQILLSLFVAILSTACDKTPLDGELEQGEYLIFGMSYSECSGNCAILFKLENQQLFEDSVDMFLLSSEIPFHSTALADAKYQIAKPLINNFPNDLLASEKQVYGCPDCLDQGGFYLELKQNGTKRSWRIDTNDEEQSQAIIDYKNRAFDILDNL
jgi:hypothetical protein